MAAVVPFVLSFLFCNVHSQLFGPGPPFPIPQGSNFPGPGSLTAGPNTLDIISPSGPINIISNQNTPNSKTVLNSAQNYGPSSQTIIPVSIPNIQNTQFLNPPSFIQNSPQFYDTVPSVIQNSQSNCINTYPINDFSLINLQNPSINQIPSTINAPCCSINQLYPDINLPNAFTNPTCFNPVQPQTIINTSPPLLPNIAQITPSVVGNCVPSCNSQPAVTTVIDNTLANSLANALQLLIVSNLIENTLGSGICNTNYGSANFIPNGPCNFEIVTPDFTGPITYEVPVVSYDCPVVSYPDPVCSIPEPGCAIPEPFFSIPDQTCSIPDFVYTVPEAVYQTQSPCIDYTSNSIPAFTVVDSNCQNQAPFAYNAPTQFVSQYMPTNIPCDIPAIASVPPLALEVPFPASIPAQLTCNFGYLPSNQPCVSFNVEPISCSSMPFFGGFGL